MITVGLPSWMDVRIDCAVLLFALAVVLLTSVLAGLLPAIRGTRHELQQALKQGSAGSSRHGRALGPMVTGEVAIATVLLMGAGLMVQSLSRLMSVDLGFRTDRTFTFAMGLSWRKYNYERARFADAGSGAPEADPGRRRCSDGHHAAAHGPHR